MFERDKSELMMDSVPTEVLKNCTVDVINKFPELSSRNDSDIWLFNRTSVWEILSDIYEEYTKVHVDIQLQLEFK